MGDMPDRIRQQWCMRSNFRGFLEIDVARQRTDGEHTIPRGNPAQIGETTNVDDEFRSDQTQVHCRHQALAA